MVRTKKQIVEQIAKKKEQENEIDLMHSIQSPPSPLPVETQSSIISETITSYSQGDTWASIQKLQSTFTNLTLQEINEMLMDCGYNEEEVILRLISQTNYLSCIRQRLERSTEKGTMRPIKKKVNIQPIVIKREEPKEKTPEPTVIEKKSPRVTRIVTGRLALDDALKQVENCQNDDDAFEGWSDARLRAYKMIDKNPNSYYYRFNAPGEQQKKGKWSDEENALFKSRLAELGANSQWGIFSIAIPGRVGYQCSNYYRFLIESGQLQDPNYVIDASGKARYLFDKKTDDGSIEKIFRKHSKHGSMSASEATHLKKNRKQKDKEDDDDGDDPTFDIKKSPYKKIKKCNVSSRITRQTYQKELKRGQQV